MAVCPKCKNETVAGAKFCHLCGAHLTDSHGNNGHRLQHAISAIFSHIPHPHIEHRKKNAPQPTSGQPQEPGVVTRFNTFLAVKITNGVGTMWCAYVFAAIALVSLPDAIKGGTASFITWVAQTFLQLVLLSIIIVGQRVLGEVSDKRALDTYNDAEAVLHEALQIQEHLAAQDNFLKRLIDELVERRPSDASAVAGVTASAETGKPPAP